MRISDWIPDVCSSDLQTYCIEVTPGDGRLVSCAEAYEDKLSSQCIAAINRAGYWLTYLATTIDYIARQCEADAAKHCPDVELGEQRVLNCLASHRKQLDEYCSLALRSEEHTSELQSLMRHSYAVFCLK